MAPEPQVEMPFFESAEDATYSAILASRKPIKQIALALWPSMKIDSAYARLKGALNPDRPEKLSADEHIFIANHCNQFQFLYYTENQCHHSGTNPCSPEDEKAELQRKAEQTVSEMKAIVRRLEAIS